MPARRWHKSQTNWHSTQAFLLTIYWKPGALSTNTPTPDFLGYHALQVSVLHTSHIALLRLPRSGQCQPPGLKCTFSQCELLQIELSDNCISHMLGKTNRPTTAAATMSWETCSPNMHSTCLTCGSSIHTAGIAKTYPCPTAKENGIGTWMGTCSSPGHQNPQETSTRTRARRDTRSRRAKTLGGHGLRRRRVAAAAAAAAVGLCHWP